MNTNLRSCIRIFAALDLLVVSGFAVPGIAAWFIGLFSAVASLLGRAPLIPPEQPLGWLFVNLAGVLGVLWALVRLAQPTRLLGALDAGGRCIVAALIIYAMYGTHVSGVLWLFVASELVGAAAQGWLLTARRSLV